MVYTEGLKALFINDPNAMLLQQWETYVVFPS
jgi:hypothetical protein